MAVAGAGAPKAVEAERKRGAGNALTKAYQPRAFGWKRRARTRSLENRSWEMRPRLPGMKANGVNQMRPFIAFRTSLRFGILAQIVIVSALGFVLTCSASADQIAISEQNFGCILDWPKVRNTYINNADPARLKEAMRVFLDGAPNTEFPVGTILQLIPTEAMAKHPRGTFAKTNDWEFFALDVSASGTKITDRGENVLSLFDMNPPADATKASDHGEAATKQPAGIPCLSCHGQAAKYDLVCEKLHGCPPIPLNDQQVARFQAADPRCAKK